MAKFVQFNHEEVPRKLLKSGQYIKIDENGSSKYSKIDKIDSVKTGKHGSAKTIVESKDIPNNATRFVTLTTDDTAVVVKMVKVTTKLIDFVDGSIITIKDENNNFIEFYVDTEMSEQDKEKIQDTLDAYPDCEEFDFVFRALPGYYKVDSIKPARNL